MPAELAEAFARAHGVDVSRTPVYRHPAVTAQAQALRARAYSRDGAVFLPAEAGPLSRRRARTLLAHELAHVAQHAVLGSGPPAEDSAAGAALEADALATERWAAAGDGTLRRAPLGTAALAAVLGSPPDTLRPYGAIPDGATPYRTTPDGTTPDGATEASPAPAGSAGPAGIASAASVPAMHVPPGRPEPMAPAAVPEAVAPEASVPATPAPGDAELAAARDRLLELASQRPLDMDDPAGLDELARRLYPRLHRELRLELLIDRERSGLLSDVR